MKPWSVRFVGTRSLRGFLWVWIFASIVGPPAATWAWERARTLFAPGAAAAAPLPWWAHAAASTGLAGVGLLAAQAWLRTAQRALAAGPGEAPAPDVPAELAPAVQRLQALQQRQDDWLDQQRRFLADASHQLRTPMAVLRTQLQSAMAGDVAPEQVLPQMLHTVERASVMADQLLSLNKLEQIKRDGGLGPVALDAVVRDAVIELAPLVARQRLDFAFEGPAATVHGDALMLGELVRNLLSNAIHHTAAGARLGVLIRCYAGRTELVVWDEGPGLDDAVRPRLFQPFAAAKGGVGLGLSICRQIADAMGATLDLFDRIDRGEVIGVDAVVAWGQGP